MSFYERIKITLDYYNSNIVTINAKQHDKRARLVEITCTNHGQKIQLKNSEVSAFVRYKKPDNTYVFKACEIPDDSIGVAMFELSGNMLAIPGECIADIMIINATNVDIRTINTVKKMQEIDNSIISTMSFIVNVHPNPIADADIVSTNEYSALNNMLGKYANVSVSIENIERNVISTIINDNESDTDSTYSSQKLDTIMPKYKGNTKEISDNLNDIIECGVYIYTSDNLPIEATRPPGFDSATILEVFGSTSGAAIIQRATQYNNPGKSQFRTRDIVGNNATWTAWEAYATETNLQNLNSKTLMYRKDLTSTDNLNDIRDAGIYVCTKTSGFPHNYPSDANFQYASVVEVIRGNSSKENNIAIIQRVTIFNKATGIRSALRALRTEGWSSWTYQATIDDVTSAINVLDEKLSNNHTTLVGDISKTKNDLEKSITGLKNGSSKTIKDLETSINTLNNNAIVKSSINKKEVTDTVNKNGNFSLGINANTYAILSAYAIGKICNIYKPNDLDNYHAHISSVDNTVYKDDAAVTVVCYYIKKSLIES